MKLHHDSRWLFALGFSFFVIYVAEILTFTDVGYIKYLFLLFVAASGASLMLRAGYESTLKDILIDVIVGAVPLILFLIIHLL